MRQVVEAAAVGGLAAELVRELRAGVERWARQGGSFDDRMGWSVPVGRRDKTARALAVRAARTRAVCALLAPHAGESGRQQYQRVLSVVKGAAPPPSEDARRALAELQALGDRLPTGSGLYAFVLNARGTWK